MAHVTGGELFGESFACAQAAALPVSVAAVESGAALAGAFWQAGVVD